MSGTLPAPDGMWATLNFEAIEVGQGMCTVEGIPTPEHINKNGTVHGGWYMAVMDTAASMAVFSMLPANLASATASFEIKLIKPLRAGRTYHARGQIIHVGRRLGHSRADMIDVKTGDIVASATASCAIFSRNMRADEDE